MKWSIKLMKTTLLSGISVSRIMFLLQRKRNETSKSREMERCRIWPRTGAWIVLDCEWKCQFGSECQRKCDWESQRRCEWECPGLCGTMVGILTMARSWIPRIDFCLSWARWQWVTEICVQVADNFHNLSVYEAWYIIDWMWPGPGPQPGGPGCGA